MQKAVDIQGEVYGVPKTTIEPYHKNNKDDMGYYDHEDGKLYVNAHDAALKANGFDEAIDTAIHENHHRHQNTMVDRLQLPDDDPNTIKKGDPLYNQAMTFKLNDTDRGYYIMPPDDPDWGREDKGNEYYTQPMEHHSRMTGRAVQNAQVGK